MERQIIPNEIIRGCQGILNFIHFTLMCLVMDFQLIANFDFLGSCTKYNINIIKSSFIHFEYYKRLLNSSYLLLHWKATQRDVEILYYNKIKWNKKFPTKIRAELQINILNSLIILFTFLQRVCLYRIVRLLL